MRWTERQRALLREMGIEVWSRPGASPERSAAEEAMARAATAPAVERVARDARGAAAEVGEAEIAEIGEIADTTVAARSRPASASEADWDALRQAAASCACGRPGGTPLGSGHPHAHWMLIGDDGSAGGADGFAGPAGVLLDNMLRAIGLTRADDAPARQVYVASVAPCAAARPAPDEMPDQTSDQTPDQVPNQTPRCTDLLLRQVQLVQPRVIVTMGRIAAQTLLRSRQPLGQLRGQLHRQHGIALICTYHPAYLLRNPEDKARAWDDLCLALQALQLPA